MPLSAPEPLNAAHDVSRFNCGKLAVSFAAAVALAAFVIWWA